MHYRTSYLVAFSLLLSSLPTLTNACTAAVFGPLSTDDGSTYTASTTDCFHCDFRLALVPSRHHPENATRPIYLYKDDYPHVVQPERSPTWHPSNLEGSPRQLNAWRRASKPIGFIPEVPHTFAVFEGGAGYALLNEHGVSLGESTCAARFTSAPVSDGGHALFDVSELSRLGLERGKTAREVIAIMGSLAEKYGFYGVEWNLESKNDEGAEALVVADRQQAWVFHILPDDTGKSAVWAAQRVPDTDITIVANNFILRTIDPNDKETFMYSSNMFDVAQRNELWKPGTGLDFAKVFGFIRKPRHSSYSNMRVWRTFTLANPDLIGVLDPHANDWLDGYPFSVTPKKKLSRTDLFRIFRDHFEGSEFDLTKGEAGGPYGDPDRYDPNAEGTMSRERTTEGEFGRPISLFRTSYTSIARSKANLPREVGSMMFFAPQQPSSSVFIPLYISSFAEVPRVLSRGSLFRYSKESLFWSVTAVSNWVHKYYKHAVGDLTRLQEELESYDTESIENAATKLLVAGRADDAMQLLRDFSTALANKTHERYTDELPNFIARYHDGFIVKDSDAIDINVESMFYPEWWLTRVGYFAARETGGSYGNTFEPDWYANPGGMRAYGVPWLTVSFMIGTIVGVASCVGLLHMTTNLFKDRAMGYSSIP